MSALVRTGLLVQKMGMSSMYSKDGLRVGITILRLDKDCQVIGHRTVEKHGYSALELGFGKIKLKNLKKPQKGHYLKSNVSPKSKIIEFRVVPEAMVDIGSYISLRHFVAGQFVAITGITIGKGFAGGMKRWNFRGLEASHGVSVSHRSIGSTGQRQDPGKTFKNKKMPGQMGHKRVTMQNEIMLIEGDLIFVKGSVPGPKNGYLIIKDSNKRAVPDNAPFPAGIEDINSFEENSNEN